MKRIHVTNRLLTSVLLFSTTLAVAQTLEEDEDLVLAYGNKATVSIATGNQQSLRRAPAVASIITAEDIKAMGARDLDEALKTVPGLHVAHTAGMYFSTYAIRGIAGNPTNPQVLVLQNGIPVNDLYRGDKGESWGGLPLENVARIEVIRGPGSALYGADAFAGVINIITKTAVDTPGTEFGIRAGSSSTWDTWVQHGGQLGPVNIAAYLRVGSTDGIKETITQDRFTGSTNPSLAPGSVNNGYDAVDGSLDFGYDKWRLRTSYKLRDNLQSGAGIASALDPIGSEKSERIIADISWTDPQFSRDWGIGFTGSYLHYSETAYFQIFPPGYSNLNGTFPNGMIGGPTRYQYQLRLSTFASYSGLIHHNLRFGTGHDDLNLYETGTHKNYLLTAGPPSPDLEFTSGAVTDYYNRQSHILPHRRNLDYFYIQDEWNFARDWILTAGLRRDLYSDFGGTTNPRLALVWDVSLDLTAKLLYGKAFRAPSFNDQYGINPVGGGNPNIKPETVRTIEAAFSWQAHRDTQINLNLFRYKIEDVITLVGATFTNTGRQDGEGMELETTWDIGRNLRLTGNYAHQSSIDPVNRADAGLTPHNQFYARTDWRFPNGWLFSPQINWTGKTKRTVGDTRATVPSYNLVDVTLRTGTDKQHWELTALVRNLFDSNAFDPSIYDLGRKVAYIPNDLPLSGRTFYLWATYKM
ncbi:iron complex outermembrane recepter protein [Gammaproteobacteria bacterium]